MFISSKFRKYKGIVILTAFCAFIVIVTATIFQIQCQKKNIRKEVKQLILEGMNETDLTTFIFTQQEYDALYWEHSKEFEFEGVMYDVVRKSRLGNKWEIVCWKDIKESIQNERLDKLIAKLLSGDQDEENKPVERLVLSLYYSPLIHYAMPITVSDKSLDFFYLPSVSNYKSGPNSPPPQFI